MRSAKQKGKTGPNFRRREAKYFTSERSSRLMTDDDDHHPPHDDGPQQHTQTTNFPKFHYITHIPAKNNMSRHGDVS
jgi:hypothetical protein